MKHIGRRFLAAWLGWAAIAGAEESLPRLFPWDPVALIAGQELEGSAKLEEARYRFRYQFATAENRAAFQAEPERFEVQMGGACARMGPLSGEGRLEIHAVHDGRLYVFASEQCRAGFLKAPQRLLEESDAVPAATPEALRRGRELVDLALAGLGGAERVDALRSLRIARERTVESGGTLYVVRKERTVEFPGNFRDEETWNAKGWTSVVSGAEAWFESGADTRQMHPMQRGAFLREFAHDIAVALRARGEPAFVAAAAGPAVDGVEPLAVAVGGIATTFGVDLATGRVVSAKYRGRGPSAAFGDVVLKFGDFRAAGGLTLPFAAEATFDGKPAADLFEPIGSIEVDGAIDRAAFRRSP